MVSWSLVPHCAERGRPACLQTAGGLFFRLSFLEIYARTRVGEECRVVAVLTPQGLRGCGAARPRRPSGPHALTPSRPRFLPLPRPHYACVVCGLARRDVETAGGGDDRPRRHLRARRRQRRATDRGGGPEAGWRKGQRWTREMGRGAARRGTSGAPHSRPAPRWAPLPVTILHRVCRGQS